MIRTGQDAGLGRFSSHEFAVSAAGLAASIIACTLLAWLKLLALDGDLARAEPRTLRYRILHAAGPFCRRDQAVWEHVCPFGRRA